MSGKFFSSFAKPGLSSEFLANCMILKKISVGKRPFIGVCSGFFPPGLWEHDPYPWNLEL
jgi:hypothetical protein